MTIKINTTEVAFKAQGIVASVELSAFHPDALDAMMEYGVRRWFQDHINSQAKIARDNGADVDPQDLFDARLAQAVSGEITVRNGAPVDPLDKYRIEVIRRFMNSDADGAAEVKSAYDAIPAEDQKDRREFLLSVAADNAEAVDPLAEELKAEAEAKAKRAQSLGIKFSA